MISECQNGIYIVDFEKDTSHKDLIAFHHLCTGTTKQEPNRYLLFGIAQKVTKTLAIKIPFLKTTILKFSAQVIVFAIFALNRQKQRPASCTPPAHFKTLFSTKRI
jgi:hypothetical protein